MAEQVLGVVMNGVTGRMGYRQHLVRSVLAIREQGGVQLSDGRRVQLEPILVGRREAKLRELAAEHGLQRWTTDLDEALRIAPTIGDGDPAVYFDAQVTQARQPAILAALDAGLHVYTEKPIAETVEGSVELARAARKAGVTHGVVHDKLYLPGLTKLSRVVDSGFFGRVLSVRGEFGYWVFEGDWQPAQRPSWNYRAEDGGGVVVDMFPHWSYVLENLIGRVEAVTAKAVTHIPERWDEQGRRYTASADDAAYAILELEGGVIAQINSSWAVRLYRDELVEFQVDGVHGSAVAGLFGCRTQDRANTPKPVWDPDVPTSHRFRDQWLDVPDNTAFDNGFKQQWEAFVRDVADGAAHQYDFVSGVRGNQLAAAGLASSREGSRVALEEIHP
ncbi:Gfo/Idh/MocA family oxidoreductase [Egibacter rhizosphaerae]|uniref:Gfo/Idh/MocA family oxidoreductase n=1 Tax=Egibacter rhizosphaerae TaxID=1670831 RepID=A0A411YCB9_9ACTN|nr:Gfo/Idh/MocA family oxidoreductase [Egibacter rhizosphaerae]QBI18802.1 Gfo/Idh/MocA family oxidoreductase [Egibacter rhizosphaerae]